MDAYSHNSSAHSHSTQSVDLDSLDESLELPAYNEEEDDPLGVKKLALSFDYLLFKIKERVEGLAEQTLLSVQNTRDGTDLQMVDVAKSINKLKECQQSCRQLSDEFMMIEQIGHIVEGFRGRLALLEKEFRDEPQDV